LGGGGRNGQNQPERKGHDCRDHECDLCQSQTRLPERLQKFGLGQRIWKSTWKPQRVPHMVPGTEFVSPTKRAYPVFGGISAVAPQTVDGNRRPDLCKEAGGRHLEAYADRGYPN